jgi:hypothetical protein
MKHSNQLLSADDQEILHTFKNKETQEFTKALQLYII